MGLIVYVLIRWDIALCCMQPEPRTNDKKSSEPDEPKSAEIIWSRVVWAFSPLSYYLPLVSLLTALHCGCVSKRKTYYVLMLVYSLLVVILAGWQSFYGFHGNFTELGYPFLVP